MNTLTMETILTVNTSRPVRAMAHPLAAIEVTPSGVWVDPIVDEQKVTLVRTLVIGWAIFRLAQVMSKVFGQQK